jgi:hypothetical protein
MQFNRFKDAALSLPALFSRSVCDYFGADVRAAGCFFVACLLIFLDWLSILLFFRHQIFDFRAFCCVFESGTGFVHGCSIDCK